MSNNFNIIILLLTLTLLTNAHIELRSQDPEKPLLLLRLQTKAFIQSAYAEIQYIQVYMNPYNHPVETQFNYTHIKNSIFHKFEAVFRNQTIVGRIFDKRKAKEIYDRESHLKNSNQNVERIYLGEIPAFETVEIRFSVIQPLKIIMNQFWSLTLKAPSHRSFSQAWDVEAEIKSNQPFNYINNPSHNIKPELFESNSKYYKGVWNATVPLNENFVIHFRLNNIEYSNTILATHPNYPDDHVLFLNFIPQLTKLMDPELLKEGGISEFKDQVLKEDIQKAKTEFIFLMDLNSSMNAEKIIKLRRILIKFLTILPKSSLFNLLSFSPFSSFHPAGSLPLSPDNLNQALAWIATISADMRPKKTWQAIKERLSAPQIRGYPRTIILLIDRETMNSSKVIAHVQQNSDQVRVYRMRTDFEVFVKETEGWRREFELENKENEDKARSLINDAVSQFLENVELKIECFDSQKKIVFTGSEKERFLFKDRLFKKWIYLRNIPDLESCRVTLSYFNSLKQENVIQEFKVDPLKEEEKTSVWHKIAYYPEINNKAHLISQVIEFSTRYQILSKLVSFLPVIIKNQDLTVEEIEKKFINITSVDKASLYFSQFVEEQLREETWKQKQNQNQRAYSTYRFKITFSIRDLSPIVEVLGCLAALIVMYIREKIKRKIKILKRFHQFTNLS